MPEALKTEFQAYDIFEFASAFDDVLILADSPLQRSLAQPTPKDSRGVFPLNLSLKDYAAFNKMAKTNKEWSSFGTWATLTRLFGENHPEYEKEIEDLFVKDPWLTDDGARLHINYARTYDTLRFILKAEHENMAKLEEFLKAHKAEIPADFYKGLWKLILKHETFFRVSFLMDCLYNIFDSQSEDPKKWAELFYENNQWRFEAKHEKFDALYEPLKALVDAYLASAKLEAEDKAALCDALKKLGELRRSLRESYSKMQLNFYLEYVD